MVIYAVRSMHRMHRNTLSLFRKTNNTVPMSTAFPDPKHVKMTDVRYTFSYVEPTLNDDDDRIGKILWAVLFDDDIFR